MRAPETSNVSVAETERNANASIDGCGNRIRQPNVNAYASTPESRNSISN